MSQNGCAEGAACRPVNECQRGGAERDRVTYHLHLGAEEFLGASQRMSLA